MLRKRRKEMRKAETEKRGRGERLSGRKDDRVKKRKMTEKLELGMPKNGQTRAGWERPGPRIGHSSHSC